MHDSKKEKLIIWTSLKLKNRQSRQSTEQEQICINYIFNKRLVSTIYKELKKLNSKKNKQPN